MKKIFRLLLLLAAVGTAAFVYVRNRSTDPPGTVRISGNIEATEAELGFKTAGRVAARPVDEGDLVKAGQVVAQLETVELEQQAGARRAEAAAAQAALAELTAGSRPEEIAQASAASDRAQAVLDALVAGARPQEVESARAASDRQRADTERLKLDVERQEGLYLQGLITLRELEGARASWQVSRNTLRSVEEQRKLVTEGPRGEDVRAARAALAETRERLALVRKGPRSETIAQARARLRAAQENLALAETTLGFATLTSPLAGLVLSKSVEPGEFVSPGTPVVTVGDLSRVWLRGYVPETHLGRVKLGQKVRVTSDTWPGRAYEGRVSFLSPEAEFTPKAVQTQKERVKLVYRVKIELANPNLELKPGMPADAVITAP